MIRNPIPVFSLEDLPAAPAGRSGWPWTESSAPLPEAAPNGAAWPAIGIVTPSYNQGRYIEETIRSVLLQGYPNLEYTIEDGGSDDETLEVVKKYAAFVGGWVSEKDRGQSHAINKGFGRFERARWINWLNSDDILLPGALGAVGEWAAGDPAGLAVIGRSQHLDEDSGKVVADERRDDTDGVKIRNWMTHAFLQPACFFSKREFDAVGALSEDRHLAMDFELWVKLGERGAFELIEAAIAQDRRHPEAKTFDGMGEYVAEAVEALFERGHAEDARRMVRDLYNEYAYMGRMTKRITDNGLYRKFVRPWVRGRFAPDHMKK